MSNGNKRDYPKIDIYVDGVYAVSTTWSRTCSEAKARYIARNGSTGKVKAVFSK